jgi:hypothetical protein
MRYSKFSLALSLCALTCACKHPDFIRLQPTIEEPPALSSTVLMSNASQTSQLIRGFYELQANTWRWAGPKFDVALGTPPGAARNGALLVLKFSLAEASIRALKTITVAAKVDDAVLPAEAFTTPGEHTYLHEAPASALSKNLVDAEFTVDKYLTPPNDGRNLALIVVSVGLEAK